MKRPPVLATIVVVAAVAVMVALGLWQLRRLHAVSYTHLTLPTIYSV